MLHIVPAEVNQLLCGAISAQTLPSLLPDAPASSEGCPRCGAALGFQNQYVGGRGYVGYEVCAEFACDYQRRAQ